MKQRIAVLVAAGVLLFTLASTAPAFAGGPGGSSGTVAGCTTGTSTTVIAGHDDSPGDGSFGEDFHGAIIVVPVAPGWSQCFFFAGPGKSGNPDPTP